jgi:hypothetical protein
MGSKASIIALQFQEWHVCKFHENHWWVIIIKSSNTVKRE